MKRKGLIIICDRCNSSIFANKKEDNVRDGGYTRNEAYEDVPKGWEHREGRNLCPECTAKLNSLLCDFWKNKGDGDGKG